MGKTRRRGHRVGTRKHTRRLRSRTELSERASVAICSAKPGNRLRAAQVADSLSSGAFGFGWRLCRKEVERSACAAAAKIALLSFLRTANWRCRLRDPRGVREHRHSLSWLFLSVSAACRGLDATREGRSERKRNRGETARGISHLQKRSAEGGDTTARACDSLKLKVCGSTGSAF
jgi:hypothetical protein